MNEADRRKYERLHGKQRENFYDSIKHLASPGFHSGVLDNDHPMTLSDTAGYDNDGYLKPETNGTRSTEDGDISPEKTCTDDNLDQSTYGYLDPISIYGGSVYIDNYLEPGQNGPPFEYTQPYLFSPAGYMAPVSSKHKPYHPNSTEAKDNDGYLKPNSRSTQDSGISREMIRRGGVFTIGNSMSIDYYPEPARNAPLFEYTQPYIFSLAGYMAPVSSKHQPNQMKSTQGNDNDGYLKPNTNGSNSTKDSGVSREKTPTEGVSDHWQLHV